jgi:sugar porter (SP) family MFS transporter
MMFQMATTIGILAAQLINYGTQNIHPWGWRLSLALAGVPAIALTIGALILPETPNSLIERGHLDRGRRVLQRVRGVSNVDVEFEDIKIASEIAAQVTHPWRSIFTRRYRPQLVIAILIPAFQQLTGINSIMFYAPQIFQTIGSGNALLQTLIIGAVNVVATLVAIFSCDKGGRKLLFTIGGIQMFVAEVVTAIILGTQFSSSNSLGDSAAIVTLVFICIFVAGFAWSWGPLGWLVPNEIQPLETRSAGQSIATTVNFLLSFIIGQAFLSMLCSMQYGTFLFFAGWVLLMTLFIWFFLPETKQVPIEEMDAVFGTHWFWKHVVPLDRVARMSTGLYTVNKPVAPGKQGVESAAQPQQLGDHV